MRPSYRRPKKQAVQLTSLLDLLFVMIFVSLIQQKVLVPKEEIKKIDPLAKPTSVPTAPTKTVAKKPVKNKPPAVEPRTYLVQAIFHFYAPTSNPGLPEGKYSMQGSFDRETGGLQLGGVNWIARPKFYDMVPLSGSIDKKHQVFTGRIEFQGCKEFTLNRTSRLPGNPIRGEWKGEYQCSQGKTGLTLTIR